MFKIFSTGL